MAKIVRFDHVGGPEVLQFKEEPSKQPAKGEVRLKVKAIGLNRGELSSCAANTSKIRSFRLALAMRRRA
jgi:NADPH:quinone reductase-like Zn-dependent oxidoreductase